MHEKVQIFERPSFTLQDVTQQSKPAEKEDSHDK